MAIDDSWARYHECTCELRDIGLSIDVSRMHFDDAALESLEEALGLAFGAMEALERGGMANVSEKRMVGHYWLRAPELAPNDAIRGEIESSVERIRRFAADIHSGKIKPHRGDGFFVVLVIGIGGSALGGQLLCDALGGADDPLLVRFIDNTDPAGIDRVLEEIRENLEHTLTVVVSKSGSTRETVNGADEVAKAYADAGLPFAPHAVAVTQTGSQLARRAAKEGWLETFPMWDFVGGRTSVTSAPGLLPAALLGIDVNALLEGACASDIATREPNLRQNPAAMLAAMWHIAGNGRGDRHMILLPYCDQLAMLARYLQQLVMESIGKAQTRSGAPIEQGLTVLGNKGSTDQHALVQQLRDGRNDFFVVFLRVLLDRDGASLMLEHDATSGDYLDAFWQGTRDALTQKDRQSITLTLDRLDAHRLGGLIALFERAVGLYAELVDVNAYDQPGVEAGKRAATAVIALQGDVLTFLRSRKDQAMTVDQIAEGLNCPDDIEHIFHILTHAAANPDHGITATVGDSATATRFQAS